MRRILRRWKSAGHTAPAAECPQSAKSDLASVIWLHPTLVLTRVA